MKRRRFPEMPAVQRERISDTLTRIGHALRTARMSLGKSQTEVATAAATWQPCLRYVEAGTSPTVRVDTLLRALDAVGLSLAVVPRDEAVASYRREKDAAAARRGQRDLFAEAREEYERATQRATRSRSA